MKIDISVPNDVKDCIGKASFSVSVYANMLESYDEEIRKLDQRITECEEETNRKLRDISIYLESLLRFSNSEQSSPEVENQLRELREELEHCKKNKRILQDIREKEKTLSREAKRIHQHALNIAAGTKKISSTATGIIEDLLSSM